MRAVALLLMFIVAGAGGVAAQSPGVPGAPGQDEDAPVAPPSLQPGGDPTLPGWAQPNVGRPVQRMLTKEEARQSLEAQGYYDIKNLRQEGINYAADARQYGKQFSLTIDGRTGGAMPKQD